MSKLVDKLTKSRLAEPPPMGFHLAKAAPENSRMQLVAAITAGVLETSAREIVNVDAVILDITKADDITALEKASQIKNGPAAGGRFKTESSGTQKKTLNSGCDFVVLSPEAPVSFTNDEKLGKLLEIETALSDIMLRTVSDLPVDAVIALEKEIPETLSVNRLMELQRLLYLFNKPLIVSIPLSFSIEELQALCDMGVTGVLVKVTDSKTAEKLANLRQAIDKLKKPAPRKKDKMSATLPRLQTESSHVQHEEEEEEEEEE